jgi:hypothetical protein
MHVQVILEMTGCCLPLLENFYMHNKPLTDLFKNEKSPRTSLSSFMFSQQGLGCALQEAPAGAIVFWQSQSYLIIFLELYIVVHILRI